MKALSIRQPWANMIAAGQKTIETRTWKTSFRGQLVIVSSRKPAIEPAGCALAVCTLVDCRPMEVDDEAAACCDWYPGAWAWCLADVQKVNPFSVRGQLGLYEIGYNYALGKIDWLAYQRHTKAQEASNG